MPKRGPLAQPQSIVLTIKTKQMKYLIVWPSVTLLRILVTLWVVIFTAVFHMIYFIWNLKVYQETFEDKSYTIHGYEYSSIHDVLNDHAKISFSYFRPRQSVTWNHYLDYVWNKRPDRVEP